MKTKTILITAVCLIALNSCSNRNENRDTDVLAEMMVVPSPEITSSSNNQEQYNPKLIKTGELTILSKDIGVTKELVCSIASECNGYVINENFTNNDYYSSYDISLNIQSSYFDLFLKKLDSSKVNIVSRIFSVVDITMKYIDDSTRISNKKKLERKYLDLLAKTNKINDLLAIEEKLEEIRTDIEVKENQLKVLDKKIAYSEFNIKIEKDISNK